jgi:hypothetical protein
MKITPAEFRKGIAALTGAAGEAVTAGLVPANVAKWVELAIGIAAFAGVVGIPNAPPAPAKPPATPAA